MAGRRGDLSLAVLRGDEDPAELGEHVGRRRRVLGPVPGRQRVRRGGGKVGCDTSTPSTTQLLPPATAGWPTPAGRGARWRRISCGLSGQTGSHARPAPEDRCWHGRHRPAPAGPPRSTPDRRWSRPPTRPTPAPTRYDSTLARAAGEGPAAAAPRR